MIIIRLILYGASLTFLLKNFTREDKKFKILLIPVFLLSFFGTTDFYLSLDFRLRIFIMAFTVIVIIVLLYNYYRDYKFERLYEIKRRRYEREKLKEIIEKNKVDSLEVISKSREEFKEESDE